MKHRLFSHLAGLPMWKYRAVIFVGSLLFAAFSFAPGVSAHSTCNLTSSGGAPIDCVGHVLPVSSSAATTCATKQSKTDMQGLPFEIRMKTTWCWNNRIVTRSSTILYWTAAIDGWTPGKPSYTSNCFVAKGSKLNCSGNHQSMTEAYQYHSQAAKATDYVYLDNEENYKGQFSSQSDGGGATGPPVVLP